MKQENFVPIEIAQVIKGRGLTTWEEYRQVRRVGRGQALHENARCIIWSVYEEYQCLMTKEKIWDEADLFLEAAKAIQANATFQPYSEVVVDEAQDLPPCALTLAALLAGGGGSERLALLVDPTQSIYYKGISWKDSNIQIHASRIRTLCKNFRNTRQILEAALILAKADPQRTLDEALQPESTDRSGVRPKLIEVVDQSGQEVKCMKKLIIKLTGSNRYRFSDIAVLCRKNERVKEITTYLKLAGFPVAHFREDSFDVFENNVKVITINSAKGLEFPVIILMDVDEGNLPRTITINDPDDQAAAMRIERQLLYVGMTRAADELYMICSQQKRSRFLQDISDVMLRHEIQGCE